MGNVVLNGVLKRKHVFLTPPPLTMTPSTGKWDQNLHFYCYYYSVSMTPPLWNYVFWIFFLRRIGYPRYVEQILFVRNVARNVQKANLMKDEQRMFLGTFLKNKSQKFWGGFLMTEARLFISRNIFAVRKKGQKMCHHFLYQLFYVKLKWFVTSLSILMSI